MNNISTTNFNSFFLENVPFPVEVKTNKNSDDIGEIILRVPCSPSKECNPFASPSSINIQNTSTSFSRCPYIGPENMIVQTRTLHCVLVKYLPTVLIANYEGRKYLLDWIFETSSKPTTEDETNQDCCITNKDGKFF